MKGTERNAYPTYQFSQLLPCVGQGLSLLGRPAGSQVGNLFCTLYLFWGGLSWKDFLHIYLPCYLPRVYLWIIIHYVYHLWILIDLGILWGSDDISMELLRRYVGRSVIMMMKRSRRKKKAPKWLASSVPRWKSGWTVSNGRKFFLFLLFVGAAREIER